MALTQVKSDGIATGAVTATQIAANAVTVDDIADGSISTAKLADANVTTAKIADDAVTADKLANTAVTAGSYGDATNIPSVTIDAQGRITAASTNAVSIPPAVGGANGVDFNDSVKARFGTGNDLEIFHDGSHSFIKDVGTGALQLSGGRITMRTGDAASEYMFTADADGAVELYYDNAKKLETTSTGIDVTGTVTCDVLTCEGAATIANDSGLLILKDNNTSGYTAKQYIIGRDSGNTQQWYFGQNDTASGNVEWLNSQNADMRFGTNGTFRARFSAAGHFAPLANNTYDLGESGTRWRNVYTNDLNLSNEGGSNDVDGTWGSWTIQEGEDDLFLLNRRNGKKYKFNLTEVN